MGVSSSRSVRSGVFSLVTGLVVSLFVAMTPAVAQAEEVAPVDAAFASIAGVLPQAVDAAAAIAAQPQVTDGVELATVSGSVVFPAAVDLATGRTFVAVYAPGAPATAPLAAAQVAADGTYAVQAPVGDVIVAVLSEGRAVFDLSGTSGTGIDTAEVHSLPTDGLAFDATLVASALISGTAKVPAGYSLAGRKVAVTLFRTNDATAVAANYVTDSGTYAIGGVPAGEYRVRFISAIGGVYSEWWNNAPTAAKATRVTLGETTVRADVSATLATLQLMDSTAPKISGSPIVGRTLKVSTGTWTPGVTFSYRWYANGIAISKATAASFVVTSTQLAKKITVKVTATKSTFSTTSLTSAATTSVVRALTSPTPTISGTAYVGKTLTAKPGTWTSGTTLRYQWYVAGVAVPKATASTFKIPSSAAWKTITVAVTGSKSGYWTTKKTSKPTASVKAILTAPTPKITGTTQVTKRLTVTTGTWTSGTTLKYQWYKSGVAITGATGKTLALTSSMAGKRITVKVTGSKSGYVTASKTSAATATISYPSSTAPTSTWNCPSWAPIKGNASSMIYHMPYGAYYSKTNPEECFRTEAAAVKAGYRKSKR